MGRPSEPIGVRLASSNVAMATVDRQFVSLAIWAVPAQRGLFNASHETLARRRAGD